MREIKFRAWSLDYKWMDYDFYIDSKGVKFVDADRRYDTPNIEIQEEPNLIVMQYTGLKDKNGVDIYEGDFVRWSIKHDLGEDAWEIDTVQFFEGSFYPVCSPVHIVYYSSSNPVVEVIGNIYQNPELLVDKQ